MSSDWVRQHHNTLFIGPTGIGKSWLACALAHKACQDSFTVLHKRTSELFRDRAVAHANGSFGRVLLKLSRTDVLLLDDFAMAPFKDTERRDFLEICDDRYQRRSLILTSQVPVAHWHDLDICYRCAWHIAIFQPLRDMRINFGAAISRRCDRLRSGLRPVMCGSRSMLMHDVTAITNILWPPDSHSHDFAQSPLFPNLCGSPHAPLSRQNQPPDGSRPMRRRYVTRLP